ncbi:MAG TPA: antibiotic biosynthesis monooxygenase [Trebonia sp.]|nr:antibiotic biosynthesis monooxygenase [Trebonia sp.]
MWGRRQRDDDWDGDDRRDQPEDRREQRPDDRRGGGFWDESGDWGGNSGPGNAGPGNAGPGNAGPGNGAPAGNGRPNFGDHQGFGDPERSGFGDHDRRGSGDAPWPDSQPPRRGRGEYGGGPGFGDPDFSEPGPGYGQGRSRDYPDSGFGQPGGFGGRGGDPGGDFRGGDRREGDRRDGGQWNDGADWGPPEQDMPVPVFTPAGQPQAAAAGVSQPAAPAAPAATSGSRPYGRLSIFTLLDDKVAEFDRLAEQAAEGVRVMEPDTLVYVMHVVPKAPMQRIIYEIYRDLAAFERHQRQPHIQEFEEGRRPCVLVTNIIDLRLKYAKVAPLQGAPQPAPGAALGQPSLPPGARHRAAQGQQAPEEDASGWFAGDQPPGRGGDGDADWVPDRPFDSGERRSQDWGPSQYTGQRYRDN